MPNLRERLERVRKYGKWCSPSTYRLLKALVEAVEPEEHTCSQCNYFHTGCAEWCVVQGASARDRVCEHFVAWVEPEEHTCGECGAFRELHGCPSAPRYSGRWYFVWPDELACERFVAQVEPEDTDAAIRNLRQAHDKASNARTQLRKELAEAKAEIERLRQEYDAAKDEYEAYKTAARDRIYNLRKERDEWAEKVVAQANAGTLFVVPNQEFEANAVLGALVRGMGNWTRLVRNNVGDYFAQTVVNPITGIWKTETPRTGPPAEALRAIQKVGDAEA